MPSPLQLCSDQREAFGPWNPGVSSKLPAELQRFNTLLDPNNVESSSAEIDELRQFTGLGIEDLVRFRPQRLMVHELLIRVCANYTVPDGDRYEDLGINFRRMAQRLLDQYLLPLTKEIEVNHDRLFKRINSRVNQILEDYFLPADVKLSPPTSFWSRIVGRSEKSGANKTIEERDREIIAGWQELAISRKSNNFDEMVYGSLAKVVGSVLILNGRIRGDKNLLSRIASNHALNIIGSLSIGEQIESVLQQGAAELGYRALPLQESPIIMNVKGASAAGKSTLRPLQQKLAKHLSLDWRDFALISPDIFRKFLLDYQSLGDFFKYAGTCSGQELQIVDQKLDGYMAARARDSQLPHLLIDRFRFDSFAAKSNEEGSNLLTRFGSKVFMFYMITPPHATVERAWSRGLQVGRYKAVDDLLDHNTEAFNGIPKIFFTWALNPDKDVTYEFLDNGVPADQKPRTVAFGENGNLKILDVNRFMDINRYQKLNVNASCAEEVYDPVLQSNIKVNLKFVESCVQRLVQVDFCNFQTGAVYARVINGTTAQLDTELMKVALSDELLAAELQRLLQKVDSRLSAVIADPLTIELDCFAMLGQCGVQ